MVRTGPTSAAGVAPAADPGSVPSQACL